MRRSDEHDIADALGDQTCPTEDERPHENVTQFAVCLHQPQKLFAADFDHFPGLGRAKTDKPTAAGEHAHFAAELPGPLYGHELLTGSRLPNHFDATGGHDKEPRDLLSGLNKHLPWLDPPRVFCPNAEYDSEGTGVRVRADTADQPDLF